MISDLKIKNAANFQEQLLIMIPCVLLEYDSDQRSNLILDILLYLELQLNCILRPLEVTYETKKKSIILPLWPIKKIISVINKDGEKQKFSVRENKLNIETPGADNEEEFVIVYDVGYGLSILKNHIPLRILFAAIGSQLLNKTQNICCHKDTEKILGQLREIYGKGEV